MPASLFSPKSPTVRLQYAKPSVIFSEARTQSA